jgi:GT2 family glycosyltransferase
MSTYTVSIIGHNHMDCSIECVNSVLDAGGDYDLILTDNGSTDGTLEYFKSVQQRMPDRVTVFRNETNEFFIRPSQRAFEHADTQFFVLLNNDCTVPKGWLDALKAPFDSDPLVVLSGPIGSNCSLRPSFHGYAGSMFEFLEGSCLMVRTNVVREKLGGLFSSYLEGGYGEDSDLSLRVRQAGHHIARVRLQVPHRGSATSKGVPAMKAFQETNHAVLRSKWKHYLKVRRFNHPIVVRRRGALGDVLLTTPIIAALRKRQPKSPVIVHTDCPQVIQMGDEMVTAKASYSPTNDAQVIDLDMAYENAPSLPYIEAYARAAEVEVPLDERLPIFIPSNPARAWAKLQFGGQTRMCAIHRDPTNWEGRDWPQDRWDDLEKRLEGDGWAVMRVGRSKGLSVDQLGAVLEICHLFIGPDSFPMHMALAMQTATLGLFGATYPNIVMPPCHHSWWVVADDAIPCAGERHRIPGRTVVHCDGACMRSISVDDIFSEVMRITQGYE